MRLWEPRVTRVNKILHRETFIRIKWISFSTRIGYDIASKMEEKVHAGDRSERRRGCSTQRRPRRWNTMDRYRPNQTMRVPRHGIARTLSNTKVKASYTLHNRSLRPSKENTRHRKRMPRSDCGDKNETSPVSIQYVYIY